ncbi:G-type lectin S-receptor-like serine/threonine-protein kinase At4g03230 [Quercus lobata]|uniref:G-type lectin S-receptor-like serine/threonine-protein kinase At4g03230 n=1 Tax=Quercus lobata TaxID=97700 RepID=UPI001247F20A|nr:G-type lectin S-receptor-like serine/threonine-protein kinase At4g03230 [Quercus lobata]
MVVTKRRNMEGTIAIIKGMSTNCMLTSMFILYIPVLLCSFHVYCADRISLRYGELIRDNETLVSPGGEFEFGFFSPSGSSGYKRYVGIWYKWDKRTVVWVANRDDPLVNSNGTFGIGTNGTLQVLDTSSRKVHWYWEDDYWCYLCTTANLIVNLTDSGNLVLYDIETSMWESFQNPTDTFLPGMSMSTSMSLTSWRDRDDPGSGNYTIKRDPLDVGDLNTLIIYQAKTIYWKSVKDDPLSTISDYFSIEAPVGKGCEKSSDYDRQCNSYFDKARLVMNFSGMIELWKQNNRTWSLIKAEPRDICGVYNFCGKFGSCNPNNKLACKCLPGFMPDFPEKWRSGDFSNGCARNDQSCGDRYTLSLKMMKGGENPQGIYPVNNENECKETCLKNCECKSYSFDEQSSCQIWTQDLLNLQEEYPYGHNLTVRVAISDIEPTARNCVPCGTNMIPYPLSTSSNCADPMYYSFDCNTTTGQVSFKAPSGTYRVSGIDPNTQKFFIQVEDGRSLRLNQSLPFNLTSPRNSSSNVSSNITNDVEIAWDPPLEPICNLTADCLDWQHSSCKSASDGKKRCLCTVSFRWDGTNLSCTQVSWPLEKRIILLLIVGITSVTVLCVIVVMYIWRRKMTKRKEHRLIDQRNRAHRMLCSESHVQDLIDLGEFQEEDEKGIDLPFYDLESIRVATHNFSDENKLGQGGYGPVYKGKLPSGQEIAVKRLSKVSGQGLKEFKNEVILIAKLQHRNLVKLYGYCIEGNEKILLYEYMPNKSLDFFIFDQKQSIFLDWEMRFNIILGIARGLLYLHQDSRLRIIHKDLKTSNVLLDHEMNPKISNFGLARSVGGKQTEANTTKVAGTYGYMSPEYALNGIFSIKSDVFSFGVVLLEIISGKKNTGFYQSKEAMSLLSYAWRLWTDDKLLDLMDETLRDTGIADQFVKCLNIGLLCVQHNPSDRPTMSIIIKMLDGETVKDDGANNQPFP